MALTKGTDGGPGWEKILSPLPSASPLCHGRRAVVGCAVENIVHFLVFGVETVTVYKCMYLQVLWPTGLTR